MSLLWGDGSSIREASMIPRGSVRWMVVFQITPHFDRCSRTSKLLEGPIRLPASEFARNRRSSVRLWAAAVGDPVEIDRNARRRKACQ
jgi:hypothetical protein